MAGRKVRIVRIPHHHQLPHPFAIHHNMWRNVVLRSDSKSLSEKRFHSCIRVPADPVIDCVSWEQAWELLKKMACNPECLDNIVVSDL